MYWNGQIVYNRDTKTLVRVGDGKGRGVGMAQWAWENIPSNSCHLTTGLRDLHGHYTIITMVDETLESARHKMEMGLVMPVDWLREGDGCGY